MNNKPDKEAIEAIHNETVRQYDLVVKSLDGLNNKAIGVIAFNGTLLSLFSLSVVQLLKDSTANLQLFLIGVAISYFLIILSIGYAAYSFRVISINAVNAVALHKEYYLKSKKEILDQLCANISHDLESNRATSITKSNCINQSLLYSVSGVAIICISLIYGFSL